MPHSERLAWETVAREVARLLDVLNPRSVEGRAATKIAGTADVMLGQLAQGIHENPALVVWPNPPRRDILSRGVYEIRYRHVHDGKDYRHTFAPGVWLCAAKDNKALLYRPDGLPLSDDF